MFSASLFNLEVIYRLSFPIYMLLIGSLFRFPFYLQSPFFDFYVIYRLLFSIYVLITGSLFRFRFYLQAPFFDLRVIYRLPFSISMLFTGSFFSIYRSFTGCRFRFTCYLQAPFFDLRAIYRLPFSIYIYLQLKWIKERVSLYFEGGGLILNTFKLSLINLYRVKYLKKAFYFWFQELCFLVTWLATPSCLYKFESNFTIVCSRNPWLILFYAHGYNHQV